MTCAVIGKDIILTSNQFKEIDIIFNWLEM